MLIIISITNFNNFITILFTSYACYYLIVLVSDLLKKNVSIEGEDFSTVHYDLEPEIKPVKATMEDSENKLQESGGGQKQSRENSQEETINQSINEEVHKNLGIDLGLETISSEGIEVTNDKLRKISNH
jgi:hypothetical protein